MAYIEPTISNLVFIGINLLVLIPILGYPSLWRHCLISQLSLNLDETLGVWEIITSKPEHRNINPIK